MANNDVVAWTASQVQSLLPGLEGAYLQEAVKYSLSLPPDDTNRHWRSLLGSSPRVDTFLRQLNERRNSPKPATQQPLPLPRLHAPIPTSPSYSRISSTEHSRTPSPSKVLRITSKPTHQKKKGPGKLTSDLGKPKPKTSLNPTAKAIEEGRPLTELEEIDSALQSISLTSNPKRHPCGCFGTKHEVYPISPNCLVCGRIICIAEGLGKCFFCGEELIEESQREELVRELRHERGAAKTREANEKVRKVRAGGEGKRVWASKVGGQMGSVVYETSSEASSGFVTPTAYDEAEKRRDELLEFDRTFAERTKIIDQQAEFTPQMTLHDSFSTPQERAAALRRLQQLEAEQAAAERARRSRVLEIDFKTGKGTVRNASAEDLITKQEPMDEEREVERGRSVGGKVDIVNGFAKPTFVET